MSDVKRYRHLLEGRRAEKGILERQLSDTRSIIDKRELEGERLILARSVLTEAIKRTQLQFKVFVEGLVTKAINSVYDRELSFLLNYDIKNNKPYIEPLVKDGAGGEPQTPKDDMGAGILDLISFAFRVVLWSLQRPRTRGVFWLDEPMRDIGKGKLLGRAGDMLREISRSLGFQLIIITHEPELSRIADRAWQVTHDGIESSVTLLRGGGEGRFDNGGGPTLKLKRRR